MAGIFHGRGVTIVVTTLLITSVMFISLGFPVGIAGASTHEITECTTIETAGSYVITQDIINATEDHCITINSSDVTVDGQGHTIDGVSKKLLSTPFSSGILAHGSNDNRLNNVTVTNVTLKDWQTGVNFLYVTKGKITRSQISDNTYAGVWLVATKNASIIDNNLTNNSRGVQNTVYGVESRTVINGNILKEHEHAISFDGTHRLSENNQILQNTITESRIGIYLFSSSNSTISSNDISNSSSRGIRISSGSQNILEDNRITDSGREGISLSAIGSVLDSNTIRRSGSWDLFSQRDVEVIGLEINDTVSFTGKNVKIRSENEPSTLPSDLVSTGQFIEVSKALSSPFLDFDSWIFLNVSYTDQDVVSSGVDESSLRLYQFNGTEWAIAPDSNGVNEVDNYVYANLSNYSIISPFGESKAGATEVNISIKPSDDPNSINPNNRGSIPVAILNTSEIDPGNVNVSSLRFGAPGAVDNGSGAQPSHGGHFEDIDDDGDLDLVIHFPTVDAGFDSEDTEGKLIGEMVDGTPIVGNDSVTIVGKPA